MSIPGFGNEGISFLPERDPCTACLTGDETPSTTGAVGAFSSIVWILLSVSSGQSFPLSRNWKEQSDQERNGKKRPTKAMWHRHRGGILRDTEAQTTRDKFGEQGKEEKEYLCTLSGMTRNGGGGG